MALSFSIFIEKSVVSVINSFIRKMFFLYKVFNIQSDEQKQKRKSENSLRDL